MRGFSETSPIFNVTCVQEGPLFGLLLEKRDAPNADAQRAYFSFPADAPDIRSCLEPPPLVREHCICHMLKRSTPLELLFEQLAAYARRAHEAADMRVSVRPSDVVYSGGYPKMASTALGDSTCEFARFIGGYDVFKECILSAERGTHVIQGKARVFRVCSPRAVHFTDTDYEYLAPMERVLEVGCTEHPEWFRKRGPVFADFEAGYVSEPAILHRLRDSLRDHPVCWVIGPRGSGKTVLARYLTYCLYHEARCPAYHFRPPTLPSSARAAREINAVNGLVILEDAHRDPAWFQDVLSRVRLSGHRHVVVTARDSALSHYDPAQRPPHEWCCIRTDLSADIKRICSHFEKYHCIRCRAQDVAWSWEYDNLWHLAYVLRGILSRSRDPITYRTCGDEVLADLEDLERRNPAYPRILVAVARASFYEQPVAEAYLTNALGFSSIDLLDLVRIGELERETINGQYFSRMPHPEIGHLYAWHGTPYTLGKARDFILDYVRFGAPNALSVMLSAWDENLPSILAAHETGAVVGLLASEESADLLRRWMVLAAREDKLGYQYVRVLANRLMGFEDLADVGRLLAGLVDVPPQFAMAVCERLDVDEVVARINRSTDLEAIYAALDGLRVAPEVAERVHAQLRHGYLAERIAGPTAAEQHVLGFAELWQRSPALGKAIWSRMDREAFVRRLGTICPQDLASCVYLMHQADESAAEEVLRKCAWKKIAEQVNNCWRFESIAAMTEALFRISTSWGQRLWKFVDPAAVAGCLTSEIEEANGTFSRRAIAVAFARWVTANPTVAAKVWRLVDPTELRRALAQWPWCFSCVRLVDAARQSDWDDEGGTVPIIRAALECTDHEMEADRLEDLFGALIAWKIDGNECARRALWRARPQGRGCGRIGIQVRKVIERVICDDQRWPDDCDAMNG